MTLAVECDIKQQINYRIEYVEKLPSKKNIYFFIWGFCRFQHCTGHVTMASWKGRGNEYIQFVRVLYCKLPTNAKQLPQVFTCVTSAVSWCHLCYVCNLNIDHEYFLNSLLML